MNWWRIMRYKLVLCVQEGGIVNDRKAQKIDEFGVAQFVIGRGSCFGRIRSGGFAFNGFTAGLRRERERINGVNGINKVIGKH
jgi:hypothetical protein